MTLKDKCRIKAKLVSFPAVPLDISGFALFPIRVIIAL